jgi:hypothetical protein
MAWLKRGRSAKLFAIAVPLSILRAGAPPSGLVARVPANCPGGRQAVQLARLQRRHAGTVSGWKPFIAHLDDLINQSRACLQPVVANSASSSVDVASKRARKQSDDQMVMMVRFSSILYDMLSCSSSNRDISLGANQFDERPPCSSWHYRRQHLAVSGGTLLDTFV